MKKSETKRSFEVPNLVDLPRDETFYVIISQASYSDDGGYSGHDTNCPYLKITVFLDRPEWADWIKTMTAGHQVGWRAFVMTPIEPKITVDVTIPQTS